MHPLFRPQVVDYVSIRQYGTVILARPIGHRVLTVLFVSIALAIIAFFVFFETTRKAQSQGILLPTAGIIRVVPSQSGVIKEKRINEGQSVREGDILFVLSSERSSTNAESPQKSISDLLQRRRESVDAELKQAGIQSRQRLFAAQRRALDLTTEIESIDGQIALQRRRVILADQAYTRFSDLKAANYISAAQLQG